MKFEEALEPTLYNPHSYMPTKKETLMNKAQNGKKKKSKIRKPGMDRPAANADLSTNVNEEYAVENFAATGAADVQGVQKRMYYTDEYGRKKKLVRRKFPKRSKIN